MKTKVTLISLALVSFAVLALMGCGSDTITGSGSTGRLGSKTLGSERDTDGDGLIDLVDPDDDNDGIPDSLDPDDDNDGIPDVMEPDRDHDSTIDDHDDNFMELEGFIESISGSDLVVFSTIVHTSDSTRVEGEGDVPVGFDDLVVGMWVEVYGFVNDDGSVDAVEIEIEGEENGDEHISPDSLQVGDYVEVYLATDSGGGLIAEAFEKHRVQDHFGYEAAVDSLSGRSIFLLGLGFSISETTIFEDLTSSGKTIADLVPGDPVEIHASYDPNNELYHADKIELDPSGESHVEVKAVISFIDYENRIVVVGGVSVSY